MLDRLSKKKRNIGLLVVLALMGWFFWTIRSVLNPLILGYLLAFVLHPAVLHLERKRGWTRPRAVNVIFLAAALFMTITLGGIYMQGQQIVEKVSAANSKDDVLRRAEHEVNEFLVKARTWSDRLTGRSSEEDATEEEDGAEDDKSDGAATGEAAEQVLPPATGESGAREPGTREPGTREPGAADPGAADPGAADPGTREPEAAEPESAQPVAAESTPDEEAVGEPTEGEPAADDPSTGSEPTGEALSAPLPLPQGAAPTAAKPQAQRRPAAAPATSEDLTLRDLVQAWWKGYVARNEGGAGAALQNVPAVIVVIVAFFGSIVSIVALVLLLPIYGYFLLFELERIHRFVRRHIPKEERERVTRIGTQIGGVIANFFRGRLLICILKGGVITLGLALAGAPYALFFGVMAGMMSLVPFVGPMLTFVCAMLFGLQELSFVSALLWIGGTFLLGEILEGYVFIPKVLGDSLGLHPVVVLVSIFAGGAALGMFGFLIAIPLTAALVILARELLLPALRQFADEDSHTDPPPVLALEGAPAAVPAVAPAPRRRM